MVIPKAGLEELGKTSHSVLQNYCMASPRVSSIALFPFGLSALANHAGGDRANMDMDWHWWSDEEKQSKMVSTAQALSDAAFAQLDIAFRATKDIPEGTELMYDYGDQWAESWMNHLARLNQWHMNKAWVEFAEDNHEPPYENVKALEMPWFMSFISPSDHLFLPHWNDSEQNIEAIEASHVEAIEVSHVETIEASHVETIEVNHVEAIEASHVEAIEVSHVETIDSSHVEAIEVNHVETIKVNHVEATEASHVEAIEVSHVETIEASHVETIKSSHVEAIEVNHVETMQTDLVEAAELDSASRFVSNFTVSATSMASIVEVELDSFGASIVGTMTSRNS